MATTTSIACRSPPHCSTQASNQFYATQTPITIIKHGVFVFGEWSRLYEFAAAVSLPVLRVPSPEVERFRNSTEPSGHHSAGLKCNLDACIAPGIVALEI